MQAFLTKLISNPAGIVATCISVFMFLSVLLTALEQMLLSMAAFFDSFDTKTATPLDDEASAGLKKAAAVLADVLGYTSKIVNWINGFKAVDPTPVAVPAASVIPIVAPTTTASSAPTSSNPAA